LISHHRHIGIDHRGTRTDIAAIATRSDDG
jgi:hypothetical protein